MLAIRMQRIGRKGHPMYRVIVQESHRQPTSGRVIANLGSYNPHTKEANLDKEQAELFLKNGAQPSERAVKLLQSEKISLPNWVKTVKGDKQKSIKNPEKLRRNQPKEEQPVEPELAAVSENPVAAEDATAKSEQTE